MATTKRYVYVGSDRVIAGTGNYVYIELEASSQPAYLEGVPAGTPISFALFAFLQGQVTSSQSAYLTGHPVVTDSLSAYLTGPYKADTSQSAYLTGPIFVIDSWAAYISGGIETNSFQSAYLINGIKEESSTPAFMYGIANTDDSQPAWLAGGLNVSDSQTSYTFGHPPITEVRASTCGCLEGDGVWPFTDDFTGDDDDPWNELKWVTNISS